MKKKILFVVDTRRWAFDNIAHSLQRKLSSLFDFDILYWEDFFRPQKLVAEINQRAPDLVHFFFREHLFLLIQMMDRRSRAARAFCARAITTHIPDYLYHDQMELFRRKVMFDLVDAYFTTNADLLAIYSDCPLIPRPHGVIHDWIDLIPPSQARSRDRTGVVKLLWSGNSRWGENAGYLDYKGLNRIIKPAVRAVRKRFPNVQFICHDSSERRVDHTVIMNSMQEADIVLIASRKEGTPLTLIEAMANACAVVSSRVGIAPEILPQEQHDFFCDHSATAFQEKLEQLIADRAMIAKLSELNQRAWRAHFDNDGPLKDAWIGFIEHALARHEERGAARKLALLPDRDALARKLTVNTLRLGARVASQLGLVETLNRTTPGIGATYHRIVYGRSDSRLSDYSIIDSIYDAAISNMNRDCPLVVYAPMWKGVCASSEAIFTENRIRFPFTDHEYPELPRHPYLHTLTAKLAAAKARAIIYSGGSIIHQTLAREVRAANPDMRQFLMWHGSPAQWADQGQLDFFDRWRRDYEDGIINGIIVLKTGLDKTLERLGIWSSHIFNPVPTSEENWTPRRLSGDRIRIGLFSSIGSWYKNPFPQLLALAGMKKVELTTSLPRLPTRLTRLGIGKIRHVEHMNHANFLSVLAQQDINLYVTNTECSPMTPLESWECLAPCIVSPAGDVYSQVNRELGDYLVEKRVDDPQAISERLQLVIDNYARISELLYQCRDEQRSLFKRERARLFRDLQTAPMLKRQTALSA